MIIAMTIIKVVVLYLDLGFTYFFLSRKNYFNNFLINEKQTVMSPPSREPATCRVHTCIINQPCI